MLWAGKRVLIVGLGRSGLAAIRALHPRGAVLGAYDAKEKGQLDLEILKELDHLGVPVLGGGNPFMDPAAWDLVVVSPGVPQDAQIMQMIYAAGIPVIGELELAYQLKQPQIEIYAVTGTNGKTTTTALLHHILERDGRLTAVGGNIGTALCSLIDGMSSGEIVVEVSSFQLETTTTFQPHIVGMLNLTPDHLDRHHHMEEYVRIKSRVFGRQSSADYLILNYDDELVRDFKTKAQAQVVYFSVDRILDEGLFIADNWVCIAENNKIKQIASLNDIMLRGKHNLENILCAVGMAWMAGVREATIQSGLADFAGVRHRLEYVAEHRGVIYINDSKGTNPDSTIKALEAFNEPIVLIAGGRAKGGDYTGVAQLIASRVKELVLLGEAREKIKTAVMDWGFRNIHEVDDLTTAVSKASELAVAGDVVLLSPACASWDMFPNYERRGDVFCQQVTGLIEKGNLTG